MAVEVFTIDDFDKALPQSRSRTTGERLFKHIGLVDGEHCWVVPSPINEKVRVLVRSSIGVSGVSSGTGEDSIRIILQAYTRGAWKALGKGPDAYTTRTRGWQKRLNEKLVTTITKAKLIKLPFGENDIIAFCKKGKPVNIGRPFIVKDPIVWLDGRGFLA